MWDINNNSSGDSSELDSFLEPSNMTNEEREQDRVKNDKYLFNELKGRLLDFKNRPEDNLKEKAERIMKWLRSVDYHNKHTLTNKQITNMSEEDIISSIKAYMEQVIALVEWTATFEEIQAKIQSDKEKPETEQVFSNNNIWYLMWLLKQLNKIRVAQAVKQLEEWTLLR